MHPRALVLTWALHTTIRNIQPALRMCCLLRTWSGGSSQQWEKNAISFRRTTTLRPLAPAKTWHSYGTTVDTCRTRQGRTEV